MNKKKEKKRKRRRNCLLAHCFRTNTTLYASFRTKWSNICGFCPAFSCYPSLSSFPVYPYHLNLTLSLSLLLSFAPRKLICSPSHHNRIVTKNNINGWVGVISYYGIPTTIWAKSSSNNLIKHLNLPKTLAPNGEIWCGIGAIWTELMYGSSLTFDS